MDIASSVYSPSFPLLSLIRRTGQVPRPTYWTPGRTWGGSQLLSLVTYGSCDDDFIPLYSSDGRRGRPLGGVNTLGNGDIQVSQWSSRLQTLSYHRVVLRFCYDNTFKSLHLNPSRKARELLLCIHHPTSFNQYSTSFTYYLPITIYSII